jgi:RHS repeat-associated protein
MTAHGTTTMVPQARDGDGNRVSETVGGATTKYLVDTLNPTRLPQVLDETVNGVVTRTYAYGLQRINENQQIGSTWTPSFYGYDGHGNVRFLTNTAGTVTDTYQYDAFGRLIAITGSTSNNFLYSGEWADSIGLYNLRARYYNYATGRFWTRDPIEGQQCCGLSWNPYIYVKGNPVNAVDPTGGSDTLKNILLRAQFLATRTIQFAARFPRCSFVLLKDILFAFTTPLSEPFMEEIAFPQFLLCLQGQLWL